mgnify:CR=1 FL=1
MEDFLTNYGITITYILLGITVLAAVGSSIINMISNTKAAIMTIVGLIALGAIAFIGKVLASDTVTDEYVNLGVDAAASENVGMGVYTFYILLSLTIAAVLYTEISKIFK